MLKKTAKPREKKLGVSPRLEKMSRGTVKFSPPIWTTVSDSKSWDINRGTISLNQYISLSISF